MSFKQTQSFNGKVFLLSLLPCMAVLGVPALHAQIITTVAGNGVGGFNGDGGPATGASLGAPTGLAVDGDGNLFIADTNNQRIRRVDGITGIITTVAGNGVGGYDGDGGLAIEARLYGPHGVAVDGAGNLFIADTYNNRIRRVDSVTGIIITVAGNGVNGYGGDGGPGGGASLNNPIGVAVDGASNLFIADFYNHRIRRVDGVTDIITTVVGNGVEGFSGDWSGQGQPTHPTSASLNAPRGVAVDGAGNLFIADTFNNRIRLVGNFYFITTVVGDGTAGFSGDGTASGGLNAPYGVAVDGAGNLFIADTYNQRIRRVDAVTGIIITVAGNGVRGFCCDGAPATSASFTDPYVVAVDGAGNLFIADQYNHRIRKVAPAP